MDIRLPVFSEQVMMQPMCLLFCHLRKHLVVWPLMRYRDKSSPWQHRRQTISAGSLKCLLMWVWVCVWWRKGRKGGGEGVVQSVPTTCSDVTVISQQLWKSHEPIALNLQCTGFVPRSELSLTMCMYYTVGTVLNVWNSDVITVS